MLLDVSLPVHPEDTTQGPRKQAEAENGCNKDHPEPDEQVNLLIEEVDGKYTLYSVSLHVAQTSHFEVAHGDPWKARRLGPVFSISQRFHNIDAIEMVVCTKEYI